MFPLGAQKRLPKMRSIPFCCLRLQYQVETLARKKTIENFSKGVAYLKF